MTDEIQYQELDAPPNADKIARLREEAAEREESVGVTFPTPDDVEKRFVVSPRGTCVLLNDVRKDSFNPSEEVEDIAEALRA